MKRALVLSGGGVKGAFEAGAVDYLVNKEELDFHFFFGTSTGALNVALLGQARNYDELVFKTAQLKKLWLDIKSFRSIYYKNFFGVIGLLFGNTLYQPVGLRRLLEKNIDLDRLFDPATVVKVTTVALETGELFYADSRSAELREDFLKYILASASMPFFFPAVKINGKHWYDGGLRDTTPLGAVFDENPDEIVVVTTYPIGSDLKPVIPEVSYDGPFSNLSQWISIVTNEVAAKDLQLANAINRDNRSFPGKRQIPLRVIAPESPLSHDSLDFSPREIRRNLKLGYAAAQNPLILAPGRLSMIYLRT